MKRLSLISVLVFLITFANIAFSQSNVKKTLSLKECIDLALDRNINISLSKHDLESKQLSVASSYGSLMPTLNLNGGWNRNQSTIKTDGDVVYVGGAPIIIPPQDQTSVNNSFQTSLSTGITLFDGMANMANIDAAKSSAISSEYGLKRTQQSIILQVYGLYFNVLRTNKILALRQDNIKYSSQTLDRIKESEKLGASSIANVYQQQAQLASDELAFTQAENDFNKARTDLTAYLALNISDEFQFEDQTVKNEIDFKDYSTLKNSLDDFKSLVNKALSTRPDYLSTNEAINASLASLNSSKGGFWPRISANASFGLNNKSLSKITDSKSLSWGLSISFPLFQGFGKALLYNNSIQQSEIQYKASQEQLYEKERTVSVDVKKALLDLEASYKSYESAKKSSEYQVENMKIIQEKYNLGASTLLDLLFATNNYNNSETTRINAIYSYLTAIKQVEYALGTLSN